MLFLATYVNPTLSAALENVLRSINTLPFWGSGAELTALGTLLHQAVVTLNTLFNNFSCFPLKTELYLRNIKYVQIKQT